MKYLQQFTFYLNLILISFTIIGCQDYLPPGIPSSSNEPTPLPKPFSSHIECNAANICEVVVIVSQLGQDKEVTIQIEADAGILFGNSSVVHEKDYYDYGRFKASQSKDLSLNGQGERRLRFPFYPSSDDPNIVRPGEYVIRTRLIDNQTTHPLFEDHPIVFLINDQGSIRPVATKSDFDTHYSGFHKGRLGLSYKLVFGEGTRPKTATLFVMVPSDEENYQPHIKIKTEGGIALSHSPDAQLQRVSEVELDRVDAGGCRVLEFAVAIDDESLPIEGIYIFNVAVEAYKNGLLMVGSEDAPVGVDVMAEVGNLYDRWLGMAIVEVADYHAFMPKELTLTTPPSGFGGRGGAIPLPTPLPTPFPETTAPDAMYHWEGADGTGGSGRCVDLEAYINQYDGNISIAHQQMVVRQPVAMTKFDFDRIVAQCDLR